jgi:hypothetical protein
MHTLALSNQQEHSATLSRALPLILSSVLSTLPNRWRWLGLGYMSIRPDDISALIQEVDFILREEHSSREFLQVKLDFELTIQIPT